MLKEGSMFELLGLRIAPFLFILNILLRENWLLLKLVCRELEKLSCAINV